jgi:hypothetical protein
LIVYDEGHRYVPFIAIRYIDREILKFLKARLAGFLMFALLYSLVIIGFSTTYYYIDNCETGTFACGLVVQDGFTGIGDSTDGAKNFRGIVPSKSGTTLRQFLPYLYFSVVTTTTVGYGDISPKSVTAAWLVIIHHLVAIGLLIGVAGQVAGLSIRQRFG